MGWIDRIFGRKNDPPTPPQKPPAQNPSNSAPPPDPKDSVTIGGNGSSSAPSNGTSSGTGSGTVNTSNPNGSTPAGLPGSPQNGSPNNPTTIQIDPVTGQPVDPKAQETRLKERMHVIETVGRGLSGDYKMGLEAGDAWAYDFGTNTIIYKKDDLIGKPDDYAVGVILQESGRRVYSRQATAPEFKDNPALDFLNNAVEGPRICNLQTSKYAGAKEFFKTVYDEDILKKTEDSIRQDLENSLVKNAGLTPEDAKKAVMKMKSPVPRHMQYALGLIYDWYTDGKGDPPDWLRDKNAIRALDATRNDFREAFKLQREIFDKDLTPKEIIDQAKHSEDIVVNKLWPFYKKLLEMDNKDLGQSMFGNNPGQQNQQGKQGGQNGKPQQGQQGGQNGKPQQGQQGQQGQQSGQSGQSGKQQGKPQQGQQGQGGGKADPNQKPDPNQKGQGQGSGEAGEKDPNAKPEDGQGGGKPEENQDKQDGAGKSGDKQDGSQGAGSEKESGDAGVPDPKDMDTSDGGKLDDSHLTDEQKEKARKAMEGLDKAQNRKVESREKRDREDGQSGQQGQAGQSEGGGDGRQTGQIDLPTLQELLKQKAETEQKVENLKTPYEKYYSQLAPLTDEMAGELKNILEENADMKFIGDFRSGRKLNMRRAMQSSAKFERTGMYDDEIWLRRSDPSKRTYDFVFIVDESGSMMDDTKWDNALKGLIMSAEALEQLKIEFSVIGFSDQPAIHKEFKDKYDEPFRDQMLAQIQRANHGGTNDSDALDTALEMKRAPTA
ncbi:MAG: VWA domain-containing protein, partial [Acidobacteria bacterium]|nr:VWA domain-containing protein [Acidobacteriota bacterium]